MGEKVTGIKLGFGSLGYSLGSKGGYNLGSPGSYSLANTGYSMGRIGDISAGSSYSAVSINKGYASPGFLNKNKGYSNPLFKNTGARAYAPCVVKNPVLHYLSMIDVVGEKLKRYRKKRYDLVGMVHSPRYSLN